MKSKIETSVCKKCGSDMGCSHKTNKIERKTLKDFKDYLHFSLCVGMSRNEIGICLDWIESYEKGELK